VTEPLRITVQLRCPADHAFTTWTERFGQWWPRGHSASGDAAAVLLEPRLGGRIYECTVDGQEVDWGEVTVWDPPHRFSYLWHIRRDRADATDVALTFVDLGNGGSRLDIVHTGWERLGGDAERWRNANADGWAGLLPHFVSALSESEHSHER
jgi:hypothetical protein